VQSVSITTKVLSSNPTLGEVYLIQHYVIKFVIDLWQVGGFLSVLQFPPPIKTDCHDITGILLKVVLNTITHNPTLYCSYMLLTCDRSVVFSGYSGFSTKKTDRHNITEILLKVVLNTINQTQYQLFTRYQ
jgi:hypothetical protein